VTRSARMATLLDSYALRRMTFSPVGGPPGPLESHCALSALSLLFALAVGGGCHRLFVARQGRRVAGALHAAALGYGQRWEIVQTSDDADDEDWLPDLLQAATAAAAAAGMAKLVARIGHDDPRLPFFEDAGFRPYSQETVFATGASLPARVSDGFLLRQFCKGDAWTLERLYNSMTPPNVRNMELISPREFLEPFARGRGLVVEGNGEVLAAAGHLPCHPRGRALVRLLVRVDAVAAGEAVLLELLHRLTRNGVQTMLLPVRDYMADCLASARLAGMGPVMTRAVLVKHTAAVVRPPVFARLREAPATLPAVNGTRIVHNGCHVPQCRLRNDGRPRRREAPVTVA
jgi:hypothetical protein